MCNLFITAATLTLKAVGFYVAFMFVWGLLGLILMTAWGVVGGSYDLSKEWVKRRGGQKQ